MYIICILYHIVGQKFIVLSSKIYPHYFLSFGAVEKYLKHTFPGNHEVRYIQQMFTFKSECTSKFGQVVGLKVWEAVNKCFDALPLAALIDNKVRIKFILYKFTLKIYSQIIQLQNNICYPELLQNSFCTLQKYSMDNAIKV